MAAHRSTDPNPQVELLDVDEATLAALVDAAVRDAAADEVTPRFDDGISGWSVARTAWLEAFHRDRRDGLEGRLGERTFAVSVAGEIAGSIRLRRTSEQSLEVGIWLRRDARGSGIGAAALAEALRKARTGGFETITAQTTANNPAAIRLLRSAGFRTSARTDGTVEGKVHLGATSEPRRPHHAPGDGHGA